MASAWSSRGPTTSTTAPSATASPTSSRWAADAPLYYGKHPELELPRHVFKKVHHFCIADVYADRLTDRSPGLRSPGPLGRTRLPLVSCLSERVPASKCCLSLPKGAAKRSLLRNAYRSVPKALTRLRDRRMIANIKRMSKIGSLKDSEAEVALSR